MCYETEFIQQFNRLASHRSRAELFSDFIALFALEMYIAVYRDKANHELIQRYQQAASRYDEQEKVQLSQLFTFIIKALEQKPYDFLGSVFMKLGIGDGVRGQYFTPPHISHFMAGIVNTIDEETLNKKGFVTVSDPCCGAGVMIIAYYQQCLEQGLNPQQVMWAEARDIDFTAAMMCYIQMNLLGIAGQVIVGNSLLNEVNFALYTIGHLIGDWESKFEQQQAIEVLKTLLSDEIPPEKSAEASYSTLLTLEQKSATGGCSQNNEAISLSIHPEQEIPLEQDEVHIEDDIDWDNEVIY